MKQRQFVDPFRILGFQGQTSANLRVQLKLTGFYFEQNFTAHLSLFLFCFKHVKMFSSKNEVESLTEIYFSHYRIICFSFLITTFMDYSLDFFRNVTIRN